MYSVRTAVQISVFIQDYHMTDLQIYVFPTEIGLYTLTPQNTLSTPHEYTMEAKRVGRSAPVPSISVGKIETAMTRHM